jgi:hypothetical protein
VLERQGGAWLAVAVTAVCFLARKKAPGLLRAWLFAAVTIAPTTLMSEGGRHFYHDRYGYVACLGFALCAGAAIGRSKQVPATAAAACALLAVMGWRAAAEAATYRDSATLWRAAAVAQPEEPLVFNRLGEALADEERDPCAAKFAFETQRRLDDSPEARSLIAQAGALCSQAAR